MTATGHAVIGTVIAAKIGDPMLAIPLSIVSHIFADAFPHWDTGTNKAKKSFNRFFIESVADLLCSYIIPLVLIVYFFPGTNIVYAYICVIGAQLLDWLAAPKVFLQWDVPPFSWVFKFQKLFDNRLDKPWGIITQVSILAFLVAFAAFV